MEEFKPAEEEAEVERIRISTLVLPDVKAELQKIGGGERKISVAITMLIRAYQHDPSPVLRYIGRLGVEKIDPAQDYPDPK